MKKTILLLIPFLLTGCAAVNYNLVIDKDLMVEEEVNISATKDYFDGFYMNLPITIVEEAYNNTKINNLLKQYNYSYELRKDNRPYPSVFVHQKFELLNSYSNNTIFKGQVFNNIIVTSDNNLITLNANGFITYAPDDSDGDIDRYPVSNLNINIKLPYVVTDNNADSVDSKKNIYTWKINEDTKDKEIKLTFDKTKIYVYNIGFYISLLVAILITIAGTIIIIKLIKRSKNNNNIKEEGL